MLWLDTFLERCAEAFSTIAVSFGRMATLTNTIGVERFTTFLAVRLFPSQLIERITHFSFHCTGNLARPRLSLLWYYVLQFSGKSS